MAVSRGFIQVLGANITTVSCHILNCVNAHDHILASLKDYETKLLISVSPTQKTIRSSKYLHFLNIFIDRYNPHSSVKIWTCRYYQCLPNANQTQSDIFPGTLLQDKFKIIELLQNSPNSSFLLLSVMTQEAKQFSSAAALISTPPRLSLRLDRSVASHYFILWRHSVEICFSSRRSGHMLLNLTGRLALPSEIKNAFHSLEHVQKYSNSVWYIIET